MLLFGLAIGAILFLVGVATYIFAPRVGPNPVFGVRIGYAYASREVWDRTNRFGGVLMAVVGVGVAALALVLQLLNTSRTYGITVLTIAMTAVLLAAVGWMFVYARRLALNTRVARQLAPVPFRFQYLAPVLVPFVLLLALAAWLYPMMPPDRMASHFNLSDRPDGWMSRDAFFLLYLGLSALLVGLDALLVLAATREPIIALERLGSRWWMEPARGLVYAGLALGLVLVFLAVVLADVGWYNLYGAHLFPLSAFLLFVPLLVAVILALFFVLGRRDAAPQ